MTRGPRLGPEAVGPPGPTGWTPCNRFAGPTDEELIRGHQGHFGGPSTLADTSRVHLLRRQECEYRRMP